MKKTVLKDSESLIKYLAIATLQECKLVKKIMITDNINTIPHNILWNIKKFINIESIYLVIQNISKINYFLNFPKKCNKLKYLYLYRNNISRLPQSISKLSNLEKLVLWHNKIKKIPTSLYTMNKIKKFDISQNLVTKIPEYLIKNKLEYLYVNGSSFDNNNILEWKTKFYNKLIFKNQH